MKIQWQVIMNRVRWMAHPLLGQDRADEVNYGIFVAQYADDLSAPLDLTARALPKTSDEFTK